MLGEARVMLPQPSATEGDRKQDSAASASLSHSLLLITSVSSRLLLPATRALGLRVMRSVMVKACLQTLAHTLRQVSRGCCDTRGGSDVARTIYPHTHPEARDKQRDRLNCDHEMNEEEYLVSCCYEDGPEWNGWREATAREKKTYICL